VRLSFKFNLTHAATPAALLGVVMLVSGDADTIKAPAMVAVQPHPFNYRLAGEFTRGGSPVNAPSRMVRPDRVLTIMTHQVTAADYGRCVLAHVCAPAESASEAFDRPAVKISWHDANTYAAWLSRQLGATYRLPTDEEWAFAAGSRFPDEVLPDNGADAVQRSLQRYEREADRDEVRDSELQSAGSFGSNENGLFDLAGSVWEWTDTCFVHSILNLADAGGAVANCGIRVVEGRHRTYMSDFIRDPRTGGCSAGKPPSHLGFRLVREAGTWEWLRSFVGRLVRG
jgi:formylglycine-generating enzyme required for sulfatase activity